jgi:hypothetical protein
MTIKVTNPNVEPAFLDFKNFLWYVWKELGLPDPTPAQYDIADFLVADTPRKVIEAFRGIGKSWVTSVYVVWRLYLDPPANFLIVSASKDRADAFSTFTKRLISDIEILHFLKPGPGQRDSNIAFDVGPAGASHSPSVKSVGLFGQMTGSRADEVIFDDIETPNNSQTQLMREQISERIKEAEAIIKPGGRITYLGTPQCEMSVYNKLPERGYVVRIWPARVPKTPEKYHGRLAPYIISLIEGGARVGTTTDPLRFTNEDLDKREASYGRSGFALQYMLDTSLSDQDKHPLRLSDLIVMALDRDMAPVQLGWGNDPEKHWRELQSLGLGLDRYYRPVYTSPEMAAYTGAVMAIDPAGKGKDKTSYAVVKTLHGRLYLTDAGGLDGGYSEDVLKQLAAVAKVNKVNVIVVESNFGGGMFTELLKPVVNKIHPCGIEEVRHSTQKEKRIIDTLEPVLNQHRLVVDYSLIQRDFEQDCDPEHKLFYQMSRLTSHRGSLSHDDSIDALAMAVAYWIKVMAMDEDNAADTFREEQLMATLDDFMDLCGGRSNRGNWLGID